MKDRIDARELSRRLAGEKSPAAVEALSPQLFDTLRDIDDSIEELLNAIGRESKAGLPKDTRMGGLKRILLRLLQVYTRRQDALNSRILETLQMMLRRQRLLEKRLRLQNQVLQEALSRASDDHEAD